MLNTLKKIRQLIEDPERWTQGDYAHDKDGQSVYFMDRAAYSFCLAGAIRRTCNETAVQDYRVYNVLATYIPYGQLLFEYNDKVSHAEIINLLDKAISDLENQPC